MARNYEFPHLLPEVAQIARLDRELRVAYIRRDRFISYPMVERILDDFSALLKMEKAVRPQGRLLVGQSLMGKSTLFNEFLRQHPADDNLNGDAAIVPVLCVQYPETAKEGIYPEILAKLNVRMPKNVKPQELRATAVSLLRQVGTRVLFVDELHNVLEGSTQAQRKGLNSIKYLMNELGRPVVAAGTVEAYNAVRTDKQISSRLRPIILERFKDDTSFQELLLSFEMTLPLRKPSNLSDPALSSQVYEMTLGVMGNVSDLLTSTAVSAIRRGLECITENDIKENLWGLMEKEDVRRRLR